MSAASFAATGEMPIRVLTFNLWGIFNSKMRHERMVVFAGKLEHYDVILLQEQFSVEDFDLIYRSAPAAVRQSYYFRRFRSSFYGSGCAVISRYPIKQAFFHTFPLQGYPEMVLHGDFFANKGAAMVRVMVPVPSGEGDDAIRVQEVTLYTTHLVAVYQKVSQLASWKKERYLPFRISQAVSLANFIMCTSRPADHVIIAGDFNCSQRSLEVQMMLILLKRHGYDMRSVLPPPRTLLDAATTEQEREHGLRLFTYSYRNAFNSMKTSYFKLLKLEADIPSQIDHIFFSRSGFALRDFSHCPDIAAGYPCTVEGGPNGLVVFTANEVHVPPQPTWYGSLWHQLLTGRRTSGAGAGARAAAGVPWGKTTSADQPAMEHMYPMSDHFGVAALLGMRVEEVGSPTALVGPGAEMRGAAASTLTADEARVVQTVVDFLEDYVRKLRSQIKTTRYMALSSVFLVVANIWVLRRLGAKEEQRTAAVLEQVYDMAATTTRHAARMSQRSDTFEAIKSQLGTATRWVAAQLHLHPAGAPAAGVDASRDAPTTAAATPAAADASKPAAATGTPAFPTTPLPQPAAATAAPAAAGGATPAASGSAPPPKSEGRAGAGAGATAKAPSDTADAAEPSARPNFRAIAEALALRPLWASTWVSSALNMTAAVVGTASFAIGMFQRAGNANILEEQVNQLKQL